MGTFLGGFLEVSNWNGRVLRQKLGWSGIHLSMIRALQVGQNRAMISRRKIPKMAPKIWKSYTQIRRNNWRTLLHVDGIHWILALFVEILEITDSPKWFELWSILFFTENAIRMHGNATWIRSHSSSYWKTETLWKLTDGYWVCIKLKTIPFNASLNK